MNLEKEKKAADELINNCLKKMPEDKTRDALMVLIGMSLSDASFPSSIFASHRAAGR